MKKILIAIDVGASGALAYKYGNEVQVFQFNKEAKKQENAVEAVLRVIKGLAMSEGVGVKACIEKVHSTPQMGITSGFSFGFSKGRCYGALRALEIPFEEVLPTIWQKIYNLSKRIEKGMTPQQKSQAKRQHKLDLYQKARDLFPMICKSEDRADALLMLNWFIRKEGE